MSFLSISQLIMAEATNKLQVVSQELMDKKVVNNSTSITQEYQDVSQLIFEFFDEVEVFSSGSSSCGSSIDLDGGESVNEVAEDEEEEAAVAEEDGSKAFWDSQEELLLVIHVTCIYNFVGFFTLEIFMSKGNFTFYFGCF